MKRFQHQFLFLLFLQKLFADGTRLVVDMDNLYFTGKYKKKCFSDTKSSLDMVIGQLKSESV